MSDMQELLKTIRLQKENQKKRSMTVAGKLKDRILKGKKTNEEWLQLKKDVNDFFQSDASEEDKKMLGGYTESLNMICSAIEEGRI
ncbi:MAG: hypothetical protein HDT30_11165 [Clostridiales bacterium]|nr:hypothetical protein [Clostridiales bacterium]